LKGSNNPKGTTPALDKGPRGTNEAAGTTVAPATTNTNRISTSAQALTNPTRRKEPTTIPTRTKRKTAGTMNAAALRESRGIQSTGLAQVLGKVSSTGVHDLSVSHAVRPPAAGISGRKAQRTGKPDQDVKVRTARLVSLTDPHETTDSTATLKPLAHAVTKGGKVPLRINLTRPIRQGQKKPTKPHTAAQGINLKTVGGTEHGTTHAAQTRAQRVKAQPNARVVNAANVRPTC